MLLSIVLFILAGLCEIGGGYLVWLGLREGKSVWGNFVSFSPKDVTHLQRMEFILAGSVERFIPKKSEMVCLFQ